MSDMCALLHGKTVPDFVQSKPTMSIRILTFAIAVDCYAYIECLRLQSQALLLTSLEYYSSPGLPIGCRIAADA